MFLTLEYELPEDLKLRSTCDSRALMAKVFDGRTEDIDVLRTLMHMNDEGQYRGSLSAVRFGARRGRVIVVDIVGWTACQFFLANSHRVTIALTDYFKGPIEERRKFGVATIADTGRWFTYSIPSFVWQRGHYLRESVVGAVRANDATNPDLLAAVVDQFRRGVVRQCSLLDVEEPEVMIFDVKIHRFSMLDVDVRSNVHLIGPWHVGRLCGRGYGDVRPGFKRSEIPGRESSVTGVALLQEAAQ